MGRAEEIKTDKRGAVIALHNEGKTERYIAEIKVNSSLYHSEV